jgi:phosphohistidine phosphatase
MATGGRLTLVLIRHAPALDREEFARTGKDDGERPLSPAGQRKMRAGARGLQKVLPRLDVLASSPLRRAWQTAELVSEVYGGMPIDKLGAAATGDDEALLATLRATPPGTTLAVVGHEPTQGRWTSWLLAGRGEPFVAYKKGEACALEFGGQVDPGAARLLWKLRPRTLRVLGAGDGRVDGGAT